MDANETQARNVLTLQERRLVYGVARDCYIRDHSDKETFENNFRNHPDAVGFSPELIILAIRLAFVLFEWWFSNKLDVPSVVPSASDPGFFDSDNFDWRSV
jgi:hypothetical protein